MSDALAMLPVIVHAGGGGGKGFWELSTCTAAEDATCESHRLSSARASIDGFGCSLSRGRRLANNALERYCNESSSGGGGAGDCGIIGMSGNPDRALDCSRTSNLEFFRKGT